MCSGQGSTVGMSGTKLDSVEPSERLSQEEDTGDWEWDDTVIGRSEEEWESPSRISPSAYLVITSHYQFAFFFKSALKGTNLETRVVDSTR